MASKSIGVFDSGFGGLTVLKSLTEVLPEYDFIYLGDNARAPYGNRSFESVYEFTLQCVKKLFELNCDLVVLACNTASAKALRNIQQHYLPTLKENKRVLGVIRPTTEIAGKLSRNGHLGILGTQGTVKSESYLVELEKFFPHLKVSQQACPMWVPLVENNEHLNEGADYFIKSELDNLLKQDTQIDTILLGCTHYPLLVSVIEKHLSKDIKVVSQGAIVAQSLKDYLNRHPEIDSNCGQSGTVTFYTTDDTTSFDEKASTFFGKKIKSSHTNVASF